MSAASVLKRFRSKRMLLLVPLLLVLVYLAVPPNLMQDVTFSRAVFDRKGTMLRLTLAQDGIYRQFVPLSEISPTLIEAVLQHEDRHFYTHPGVNPMSLMNAALRHVAGGTRGGASTITMQLARLKNNLHTRSYAGKLRQMLEALRLELHYSKQEILEAYLNLAPYGGNIEGVGAASHIYFGRDASTLSLPEALTLAVVPQRPKARTPGKSKETDESLASARLREFNRWKEIHPEDAHFASLLQRPMRYGRKSDLPFLAPQWSARMLRETQEKAVHTTLDADLQQALSGLVQRYVQHNAEQGMANAAALLVDTRDSSVVASIGSADYFNLRRQGMIDGTRARRSPGSALKPFIYALGLQQGFIHPATLMVDAPTAYGTYAPDNFDHHFQGPLSAHDALTKSRNIPALWLMDKLAHPAFYDFLKQAGIEKLKPEKTYGLSLAIGGAEVTMEELLRLYVMLARDGVQSPLRFRQNETLASGTKLLSPEAAFITLDMLKDTPPPGGSATSDTLPLPVYWKTGTSGGLRDAWSVGVFGHYALAVWVGDFHGTTRGNYVGIVQAAPLFFEIVKQVAGATHAQDELQEKAGKLSIAKRYACTDTGDIESPYCTNKAMAWVIPGVSPIKPSNIYRRVLVDRDSGKLACHFVGGKTDYRVMQFWPSDIIRLYADAGIEKPQPPAWQKECAGQMVGDSKAPLITSPPRDMVYRLRAKGENNLPLKATLDGSSRSVFWFMDNALITKAQAGETVFAPLKPGKHIVRAVDDAGRADSRAFVVE